MSGNVTLYRPVGLAELSLIYDLNYLGYPPRLPEQPIFYPVLNQEYARQIARDWTCLLDDSQFAGFVTAFDINAEYVSQYETQVVGGRIHQELWVPADNLGEFNAQIVGPIRVLEAYFGEKFTGCISSIGRLNGLSIDEQWKTLHELFATDEDEFQAELKLNAKVIALNKLYWGKVGMVITGDTSNPLSVLSD